MALVIACTAVTFCIALRLHRNWRRAAREVLLPTALWLSPVAIFVLLAYPMVKGRGRALEWLFTPLVVAPLVTACVAVIVTFRLRGRLTRRDAWMWLAFATAFGGFYLAPSGEPGLAVFCCVTPFSFFMLLHYFDDRDAAKSKDGSNRSLP